MHAPSPKQPLLAETRMEQESEIVRDGNPNPREAVEYRRSYLMQAQALAIAYGAVAYAIQCIENGNPGTLALQQLRKDQAAIKELM